MYFSKKSGAIIHHTINNQFQITMKSIVLLSVVLGSLLLTSCTNNRVVEVIPHKTFQYSYQNPSRILIDSTFSKQLSTGKLGTIVQISSPKASARLGHTYYSANGNNCRKYTINSSYERTACNVKGRWYQASSVIISKQN